MNKTEFTLITKSIKMKLKALLLLPIFCLSNNLIAQTAIRATATVNVRSTPSATSSNNILGTISPGTILWSTANSGGWYTVSIADRNDEPNIAYISNTYAVPDNTSGVLTSVASELRVRTDPIVLVNVNEVRSGGEKVYMEPGTKCATYAGTAGYTKVGDYFWYKIYLLNSYTQNFGWVTNNVSDKENYVYYESSSCKSPRNFNLPSAVSVQTGQTLSISSISGIGTPPFTYQWRKNDVVIPNQTGATLQIASASASDEGRYTCIVINSCGSWYIKNETAVTVTSGGNNAPSVPTGLTATGTSSQITFTWNEVTGATQYELFDCTTNTSVLFTGSTSYTFTGLDPNVKKECKVRAMNASGVSSDWSSCVSATTNNNPGNILEPPTNVFAQGISCTGIHVEWTQVPGASRYELYENGDLIMSTDKTSVNLLGKELKRTYSYAVKACNDVVCSNVSKISKASPILEKPIAKANIVALSRILVSWESVCGADYYEVYNSDGRKLATVQTGNPNEYLHVNALTDQVYCFYVIARSNEPGVSESMKSDDVCNKNTLQYIDIQNLRFTADKVNALNSNNVYVLMNNVRCGLKNDYPNSRIVKFTGTITADLQKDEFTGNGIISLDKGQRNGNDLVIFNGNFKFSVLTSFSNLLSGISNAFALAGLDLTFDKIEMLSTGVNIEGDLRLPVNVKHLLSNTNIEAHISQVQILQNKGVNVVGSLGIDKIALGSALRLDNSKLDYNGILNSFEGKTTLVTPIFDLSAVLEVFEKKINKIGLNYSPKPPLLLGTTGFAIQSLGGGVNNLNNPTLPLAIKFNGTVVPAVFVSKFKGLSLDLSVEYQLGTSINSFSADSQLKLFNKTFSKANITLSGSKHALELDLNADIDFCLMDARFKAKIARQNMNGNFNANFKVPCPDCFTNGLKLPAWLQDPLKKLQIPCDKTIFTTKNIVIPGFIAGYSKLGFKKETFFGTINLNYGEIFYSISGGDNGLPVIRIGTNYEDLPYDFKANFSTPPFEKSAVQDTTWYAFNVNKATQSLIIEAYGGKSGLPQFWIKTPANDTIKKENVNNQAHIKYYENANAHYAAYYFRNPKNGDFFVGVINADSISVKSALVRPSIELINVQQNRLAKTIKLNWVDECPDRNASISIGYDTDVEGADGVVFVDNISQNSSENSYQWEYPDDIRKGKYYFYALIKDSIGLYRVSYFAEPFNIGSDSGPNTPSGVRYRANGDTINLKWNKNNPYSTTYIVYYSNLKNTVNNRSRNFAIINDTSFSFTHFTPGRYYEFMITALDTFGNESNASDIVGFFFQSTIKNNLPFIKSAKSDSEIAYLGNLYSITIEAEDIDGDRLVYFLEDGPVGMSINPNTGKITWQPNLKDNDLGYNNMKIKVSDGKGGLDSISYQIQVLDEAAATATVQFNKALYLNYDDQASVFIEDADFIGKENKSDSISVRIYSTSDPIGFNSFAKEIGFNSKEFIVSFSFDKLKTSGNKLKINANDTVWISFVDVSMKKKVVDFSYFTEVKADFDLIPSICSNDSLRFKNISSGSGFSYSWSVDGERISGKKHPLYKFKPVAGTSPKMVNVTLSVRDEDGRSSSITKTISVFPLPVPLFSDTVKSCYSAILDAGNPGGKYLWSNNSTTQQIKLDSSQKIKVRIIDAKGCVNNDSTNLTIYHYENLLKVISLNLGDKVNLTPTTSLNWQWQPKDGLSCDNCESPEAMPIETTLYKASAIDNNGCMVKDSFNVIVRNKRRVYIPNVFSPNNDGINDLFIPNCGKEVNKIIKFYVFNRWGAKVFGVDNVHPNDIETGWNGTFKGSEVEKGSYSYIVQVEYINGKTQLLSGDVMIIR